MADLQDSE